MKIFGVGTDIVRIKRVKNSFKKRSFLSRIFNKDETLKCKKSINKFNCFAKRFAAKEALFKAVGAASKLQFKDVEVRNNFSDVVAPHFWPLDAGIGYF